MFFLFSWIEQINGRYIENSNNAYTHDDFSTYGQPYRHILIKYDK